MKEINNFIIWYEYDILGWPPILLGKKYGIESGRICNMARKKRAIYDLYKIPEAWTCLPRWNKDRDGTEWPPKGEYRGI